jgi:hypothetical protein
MDPAAWLERTSPGFARLSAEETNAIKNFTLLWTFFEGRILHTGGSVKAILQMVESLKESGKLNLEPFRRSIRYFTERYYDGKELTHIFRQLHMRSTDRLPLVEKVLRGQSSDDAEILAAVLIIVLRLRNNLFHGVKWSYEMKGQLDNFQNANEVLMAVIDLHKSGGDYRLVP